MDKDIEDLRQEVAVLRGLVAFALPCVPLSAVGAEIQAELDRAVFGADFVERADGCMPLGGRTNLVGVLPRAERGLGASAAARWPSSDYSDEMLSVMPAFGRRGGQEACRDLLTCLRHAA